MTHVHMQRIASLGAQLAVATVMIASTVMTMLPVQAHAVTNPTATPKVSFTFDDGYTSALTQAAPTLQKYGFSGTNYVITGCVGMVTVPNTCQANNDATYMTWDQIKQLQSTYKWEIGSHTANHRYLATSDPVDQPQPLTTTQMQQELSQSKAALAAQGINAVSFAPPYGDYNPTVLAEIAKNYGNMRGFQDTGYNTWPYNEYLIRDQEVQGDVSVATVKSYVDAAIANNTWLVLTFHDIKTTASTNPDDYEYSTANLDAIAAYVKSKNVPVVNVKDAFVANSTNLLANATFTSGVSGGWTTNAPATITADNAGAGSYPDATNSVKLVATANNTHLFSPKVAVTNAETYLLKSYLNVQQLTSGEVAYYIDEYDANGNWISGQYKTGLRSVWAQNVNFSYVPSSASVKQASLQLIVTGGSGITAYFDNAQWFSLAGTATTPPTTLVSQTNNLLKGKAFTSTVADSTVEPGNPLANINDANEATRWISQPTSPVTLTADMGAAYQLSKISILWAGDTTKNYDIQLSTDNVTWTTVASGVTNNTQKQLIDHTTFTANTLGRYFRIVGKDRWNTSYGNSIWEIGAYGTPQSLVNGTFDGGIANGWTTDTPTAFAADSANHGSPANATNAVKLTATTKNAQLFSPKVTVTSTKTYTVSTWVNALTLSAGEVGFYIDEYDANGNWISGQYKGGVRSVSSGDAAYSYTPSSAAVTSASLQIILVGNSGITGYVDDVRWY